MKFVVVNQVERGIYNEDNGTYAEASKPTVINAACIRAFYARKDGKPGTRITFNDGGGFAVTEPPDVLGMMVAGGDIAERLALAAPVTTPAQ
jgi:hypothetical protein